MLEEPRNEAGSGTATVTAVPSGQAAAALGQGAGTQHADGTPVRVLVVDDEPSLAELLSSVLRYEGWSVRTAGSGAEAVKSGRDFRPDAVVLDIMLPDFDGVEVMRRLRSELPGVCVLFLTARDAVEDRVAGLTAGGDDYVTKPFSLEEVLARLRGLLRRANLARTASGEGALVVSDLSMDEDAREVRRGGELIELTATEFELLATLARRPGRIFTRGQLLDVLRGASFESYERSIDTHVKNLRRKLEPDPRAPRYVLTVYGVGYRFADERAG